MGNPEQAGDLSKQVDARARERSVGMKASFKAGEERLQKAALVVGRVALAYLFFTQLWWKTPPTFGCPPD